MKRLKITAAKSHKKEAPNSKSWEKGKRGKSAQKSIRGRSTVKGRREARPHIGGKISKCGP